MIQAISSLQSGLCERDAEVRLMLLAALAGEHILFIGPSGTAKSEMGRRLASLCSGTFFERLLTRFSVPKELFGPLSMNALVNLICMVGASNELPETEELDAPYDRFLIRRQVSSVSPSSTSGMLKGAVGLARERAMADDSCQGASIAEQDSLPRSDENGGGMRSGYKELSSIR
ncbi:hypothetical protein WJX73_000489 [Symbiochloris irregularis]|uniref:MoxR domain-containing protein n=1 Tax=Symbiochloris irregularis TaxID=706552 RepID=A0AAW1NSS0_9CHLO